MSETDQPRPERTFEIVAGKVLSDQATRFAFVREGSASGGDAITRVLGYHGTTAETRVTVLSDGDGRVARDSARRGAGGGTCA
jgi:hypothetical protein